jgi:5-methylcytosine-specific restriction endonuclease McrA
MSAYVPIDVQRQVRERFANCCAYCRTAERLTATTFELEHILPRSAGGETRFENLCLSCPMCNRYKSSSSRASDPVSAAEVALFDPQKEDWTDHFA